MDSRSPLIDKFSNRALRVSHFEQLKVAFRIFNSEREEMRYHTLIRDRLGVIHRHPEQREKLLNAW